jgi:hypothetical protein
MVNDNKQVAAAKAVTQKQQPAKGKKIKSVTVTKHPMPNTDGLKDFRAMPRAYQLKFDTDLFRTYRKVDSGEFVLAKEDMLDFDAATTIENSGGNFVAATAPKRLAWLVPASTVKADNGVQLAVDPRGSFREALSVKITLKNESNDNVRIIGNVPVGTLDDPSLITNRVNDFNVILAPGQIKVVKQNFSGNSGKRAATSGSYLVSAGPPSVRSTFINAIDIWCVSTAINKQSNTPYDNKAGIVRVSVKFNYTAGEAVIPSGVATQKRTTMEGTSFSLYPLLNLDSLFGVEAPFTPAGFTIPGPGDASKWQEVQPNDNKVSSYGISTEFGDSIVLTANEMIIDENGNPSTRVVAASFDTYDLDSNMMMFSSFVVRAQDTVGHAWNCNYFRYSRNQRLWILWDPQTEQAMNFEWAKTVQQIWYYNHPAYFQRTTYREQHDVLQVDAKNTDIKLEGNKGVAEVIGDPITTVTDTVGNGPLVRAAVQTSIYRDIKDVILPGTASQKRKPKSRRFDDSD